MARPGFMVLHAALDILAGEPPEVVGAYVLCHQYIARKNLGGRMAGARRWSDGTWRCACRVARKHAEALVKAGGAEWDGDDLVLEHYDQVGQDRYGGNVKGAEIVNARKRARRQSSDQVSEPPSAMVSAAGQPLSTRGGTAGAWAEAEDSPASPPSGLPARDDGGDDREYSPHDQPGEPEPQAERRHLTTAVIRRVDGVDDQAVIAAAKDGSLMGVVAAFGGNCAGHRQAEWRREADGLATLTALVLFADARSRGSPIREPSGFRAAREHRLPSMEPLEAAELLALYGLKPPRPAKASA